VKAYVRAVWPFYECSEKGTHDEKEDPKPLSVAGTWWHESMRILGAINKCALVLSHFRPSADPFCSLNIVMVRLSLIYGPYINSSLSALCRPPSRFIALTFSARSLERPHRRIRVRLPEETDEIIVRRVPTLPLLPPIRL
jgi:hypothetical protein